MSEHGSFVTEYIYCAGCFARLSKCLLPHKSKYLYAEKIGAYPIIAGKVGGFHSNEELETFLYDDSILMPESAPCHPVNISVITESGKAGLITFYPSGEKKLVGLFEKEVWDTKKHSKQQEQT